jgi:hypothetical protein
MKKIISLFLVSSVAFFAACSDDEKPKSKDQDPLSAYLEETGFTEVSEFIDDEGSYEFGISFIPEEDGEITSVVVRLPDDQVDLRVSIWDVETETLLRTETIANVVSGVKTSKSITPLELEEDHEYMITLNANDYYYYVSPEDADATYPITVGDISITGFAYANGTTQILPINFDTDYYAGDLSFIFRKDD